MPRLPSQDEQGARDRIVPTAFAARPARIVRTALAAGAAGIES